MQFSIDVDSVVDSGDASLDPVYHIMGNAYSM